MPITAKCRAVSNYIIEEVNSYNKDKSIQDQVMMSLKRLQRILYLCNIEYMIKYNGKNLFDDYFYAWPTGPVIPGIYYVYIPHIIGKYIPIYEGERIKLANSEKFIIHKILKQTQNISTMDLIKITNISGGPWEQFYNEQDPKHNQVIPSDIIYNYHLNNKELIQIQEEKEQTLVKALIKNNTIK